MASRVVVRRRARPGVRAVQGTGRSVRETRRRLESATWKTDGARDVRAEGAWGVAWLWTFQGIVQPCGSMDSSSPAVVIASFPMAREMGERAVTGTKQVALEGSHASRSVERPPPGTMEWL